MGVEKHKELLLASRQASSRHQQLFDGTGVSSAHWLLLRQLRQAGPSVATKLAERLHVSRQAVQRLAARLEAEGDVASASHPIDRRKKLLAITPQGDARLAALDESLSAKSQLPLGTREEEARPSQQGNPPRQRSFEVIRTRLLQAIEDGDLRPGTILPAERELASTMEVGRPVIREALRSLESAGVVEILPGPKGGARVLEAGGEGLRQSVRAILALGQVPVESLLEMRSILLAQAARLAAIHGTGEDFDAIEDSLIRFEITLRDKGQMASVEPAIDFYRLVGAATRNRILALLMEAFADLVTEMLMEIGHWPITDSLGARQRALAAMRQADADAAEQIMRTHSEASNAVLAAYKSEHDT